MGQQYRTPAQESSAVGWSPDRYPEGQAGPYAHLGYYNDESNTALQAGLGVASGENGNLMSANGTVGTWGETSADARVGVKADAQVVKGGGFSEEYGIGGEAGLADASAEMSVGADGLTVGAGAALIDGAVTLGGFNADDSALDSQLRIGAGLGPGVTGRAHWGDSDGDGYQELGLGADIPCGLSFDVKTEALGHAWDWLMGEEAPATEVPAVSPIAEDVAPILTS